MKKQKTTFVRPPFISGRYLSKERKDMRWLQKFFQGILILLFIGSLGIAQTVIIMGVIPRETTDQLKSLNPVSPKSKSAFSKKAPELSARQPQISDNDVQAANSRAPQPDLKFFDESAK